MLLYFNENIILKSTNLNALSRYLITQMHLHLLREFFFCGAATQRGSWPPHS